MAAADRADLAAVGALFGLAGRCRRAAPLGGGHIHRTFVTTWEHEGHRRRFVHQRLNTNVFPDPEQLMAGIARVTAHLAGKLAHLPAATRRRRVLTFLPTVTGGLVARTADGSCWRTAYFVEGARRVGTIADPHTACEAGRAFGEFLALLADLPGPRLAETLPAFHDTPRYLDALAAAAASDPVNRALEAGAELEFAFAHQRLARVLVEALAASAIPERIVHNDTKVDNLLFDTRTGNALCVVDLDTVMPGTALYDFGDLVRSSVAAAPEDATDPATVEVRPAIFEALVRGYLTGAGGCLASTELELFVTAASVITLECGVRFLSDHLRGDVYFPVAYPGHNLTRARVQFALLRSLSRHAPTLEAMVQRLAREVGVARR